MDNNQLITIPIEEAPNTRLDDDNEEDSLYTPGWSVLFALSFLFYSLFYNTLFFRYSHDVAVDIMISSHLPASFFGNNCILYNHTFSTLRGSMFPVKNRGDFDVVAYYDMHSTHLPDCIRNKRVFRQFDESTSWILAPDQDLIISSEVTRPREFYYKIHKANNFAQGFDPGFYTLALDIIILILLYFIVPGNPIVYYSGFPRMLWQFYQELIRIEGDDLAAIGVVSQALMTAAYTVLKTHRHNW